MPVLLFEAEGVLDPRSVAGQNYSHADLASTPQLRHALRARSLPPTTVGGIFIGVVLGLFLLAIVLCLCLRTASSHSDTDSGDSSEADDARRSQPRGAGGAEMPTPNLKEKPARSVFYIHDKRPGRPEFTKVIKHKSGFHDIDEIPDLTEKTVLNVVTGERRGAFVRTVTEKDEEEDQEETE